LFADTVAEIYYAHGHFVAENSEHLFCNYEDRVDYKICLSMAMFHADSLLRRVTKIIDRVVEAGLYNYRISLSMKMHVLYSRKIAVFHKTAVFHPLAGYYSFNLYHMQLVFYFFDELVSNLHLLYGRNFLNLVLNKRKLIKYWMGCCV
jgi:hypothetical protein